MKKFIRATKGAPLVEYVVLLGGLAVLVMASVLFFGNDVRGTFNTVTDVLENPEEPVLVLECDAGDYGGEPGVACDPFVELIDECDLESLAVMEFCPGTGITYIGDDLPDEPGRTYTLVPDIPGAVYPPGYEADARRTWDSVDADYGNFYAVGYEGGRKNHSEIMAHPRLHPAAQYCQDLGFGSYLPSPRQLDIMDAVPGMLAGHKTYLSSSQYWGAGGFSPVPLFEPINYVWTQDVSASGLSVLSVIQTADVTCVTNFKREDQHPSIYLDGTPGDDNLSGNSWFGFRGFEGNDVITGNGRLNHIYPGAGDDVITGGGSWTTVYFEGDFGNDTFRDTGGREDSLIFDSFSENDVSFALDGSDVVMTVGSNTLRLPQLRGPGTDPDIEVMMFTDATWDFQQLLDRIVFDQRPTGTVIGSYDPENHVHALGDGSYTIYDYGNFDTLTFTDSASTEWVLTQSGRDMLLTNIANGQVVRVSEQFDVDRSHRIEEVTFTDGSLDWDNMMAVALENQKSTGLVTPGYLDDTLTHALGDGTYTIQEWNGTDTLTFVDTASTDWAFTMGSNNSAVLTHNGTGEAVTIYGQYSNQSGYWMETVAFTDRSYTPAEMETRYLDEAKPSGALVGGSRNTRVEHSLGDGSYSYADGSGYDGIVFLDSASTDWHFRLSGADLFVEHLTNGEAIQMICAFGCSSSQRYDYIEFTDGPLPRTQVAALADLDNSNRTRNTYGALRGTWYNSSFFHDIGDGSYNLSDADGVDILTFTDSASTDWDFTTNGSNFIGVHTSGETITWDTAFVNNRDGRRARLDQMHFTDVAYADVVQIQNMVVADMKPTGYVRGPAGYGTTFVHAVGDGTYTIYDNGGTDALIFTNSNFTDWSVSRSGNNLVIDHNTASDIITIQDYYATSRGDRDFAIESFQFQDTTLDRAAMDAAAP